MERSTPCHGNGHPGICARSARRITGAEPRKLAILLPPPPPTPELTRADVLFNA